MAIELNAISMLAKVPRKGEPIKNAEPCHMTWHISGREEVFYTEEYKLKIESGEWFDTPEKAKDALKAKRGDEAQTLSKEVEKELTELKAAEGLKTQLEAELAELRALKAELLADKAKAKAKKDKAE